MPSIFFSNKVPVVWHWLFAVICVVLGLKYELEPLHALRSTALFNWWRGATGGLQPNLEPRPDTMIGARPLIDYGTFEFFGCDLALRDGQRVLVTNWQGVLPEWGLTLTLRFVAPTLNKQIDSYYRLVGDIAYFDLPDWYHEINRPDETWLTVLEPTGYWLPAHRSLVPNIDSWFRVCE